MAGLQAPEIPDIDAIDLALAERCLRDFVRQAWPIIEPGREYLHNWHIDAICEHLEAVSAGQITRLLINMPPRYMKSISATVMWPVWEWTRRPELRYLVSSYSQSLSTRHSVDRRTIIESDWYRARWGHKFALTGDQNVKTEFRNDRQGVMFSTSMNGTTTGKGGDRVIVDDPHNVKEAESDTQREAAVLAFDRSLSTRLDDKRRGAIVVIMQRLHEHDLSGHLLGQEGWTHLCLEAEADQHLTISLPSGRTIAREPGELLWPDVEGPPEIARAKVALGPYGYAGQYQQRPSPAGGGRFKSAWLRYFDVSPDGEFYRLFQPDGSVKVARVSECDRFAMMDPAGVEKTQNTRPAYTVIGAWDVTPAHDMVLFDMYRDQVESPVAAERGIEMCRRHDCPWIGVEKDGIGLGVVQTIRRRGVTVKAIKARGSKEARSETAEIRMAAGMVYIPKAAPWRFDFERELAGFPTGEFKDQVDMLAHAAIHVHKSRGAPGDEDEDGDDGAEAAVEPTPAPLPASVGAPGPAYREDVLATDEPRAGREPALSFVGYDADADDDEEF